MKAIIKNNVTGVLVPVTAATDHPACSYGQAVWVDESGTAYFQLGMVNPVYSEVSIDFTTASREELGQLIRGLRISQGVSIRDMAERVGVQKATVQNIEKGAFTPRLDIVQRMLSALGQRMVIEGA